MHFCTGILCQRPQLEYLWRRLAAPYGFSPATHRHVCTPSTIAEDPAIVVILQPKLAIVQESVRLDSTCVLLVAEHGGFDPPATRRQRVMLASTPMLHLKLWCS